MKNNVVITLCCLTAVMLTVLQASTTQAQEPIGPMIVGGQDVPTPNPYRYQVSIQSPDSGHFCGGSVVADTWILTAAHCLKDGEVVTQPDQLKVVVGRVNLTTTEGAELNVQRVIVHPDYDAGTNSADIALLQLTAAVPDPSVAVPLMTVAQEGTIAAPGATATVTGWGGLQGYDPGGEPAGGQQFPDMLKFVETPILATATCNVPAAYNGDILGNMICAGSMAGGIDSCQGDSGGPLVVPDGNGGYIQTGVVSFGYGCAAPNFPGIYARVTSFRSWIDRYIGAQQAPQPIDPVQVEADWTLIVSENFESTFPGPNWQLTNEFGDSTVAWGTSNYLADDMSTNAAWPAAGGSSPATPANGYPTDLAEWMIYGPINVSQAKSLELFFLAQFDIAENDTDWAGVCAATYIETPFDFFPENEADPDSCYWFQGTSDGWEDVYIDLSREFAGKESLYLGWVFYSGSDNSERYTGPFIDDIELWGSSQPPTELDDEYDFDEEFEDWTLAYSQTFDINLATSTNWNQAGDEAVKWTTTEAKKHTEYYPTSKKSVAPASYTTGKSWLIYGPVDLTNLQAADVSFVIMHDLIVGDSAENSDWLAFCATASSKNLADIGANDFILDNCEWWTGSSDDGTGGQLFWDEGYADLTPYVGESKVYLAFYLESNAPAKGNKIGVYVDDLEMWTTTGEGDVDIDFTDTGKKIVNGDFSNNLTGWSQQSVAGKTGNVAVANSRVVMTGSQYLFQGFSVPAEAIDLLIRFNYSISSTETVQGDDRLCVSLATSGTPTAALVQGGCLDAADIPFGFKDGAQLTNFAYSLTDNQLQQVKGQTVDLVISLNQGQATGGTSESTVNLDDVVIYATGKAATIRPQGSTSKRLAAAQDSNVATQRDPNEPNDTLDKATTISCGQTLKGVFGDVGVTNDPDWFVINRVPVGEVIIDVDAKSKRPASAADSLITMYSDNGTEVGKQDDDGTTLDSRLVYNNQTTNATYYIELYNYNGGGPEHFYDIKVQCANNAQPQSEPETVTSPAPPSTAVDTSGKKAWTLMLYLNAEDQKCVKAGSAESCWNNTYEGSIAKIEQYYADKASFLNVVVMLDGPNFPNSTSTPADTYRYVIQAGKSYLNDRGTPTEKNLGDPQTLKDFVKWAMTNYPAENYFLSIDDHGNGPFGIGWDHTDTGGKVINDQITPAELRSVLKEVTNNGQQKIAIFDYEACLMGFAENAYDLKNYVDYVAFFQPISWTSENYPEYFRALTANTTPRELGINIIDQYPVSSRPYSFSLIDTSKMEAVKTAIDDLATALMQPNVDLAALTTARNASQAFNGDPEKGNAVKDNYGYIDIWDLADNLQQQNIANAQAQAVKTAVEGAVVKSKAVPNLQVDGVAWNYSRYKGLSILYPKGAYNFLEDNYCRSYLFTQNGKWDDFLTAKVFAQYSWNCPTGTATTSRQAGTRPTLNAPNYLVERPLVTTGASVYLPIVVK